MSKVWVVVADASRARIFQTDRHLSELHEAETLSHPESRLHEQDMTSDLPGRSFDSQGEGRHAMGQDVEPKKQEAINFAKTVAGRINSACVDGACNQVVVVAAPAFLGLLRDSLNKQATDSIAEEIAKDLTQHSVDDIKDHLPKHI